VFSGEHPLLAAIPLDDGEGVLGRDEALGVTDDRVSRQHALVTRDRDRWQIRDEGSRNGTFVNGTRIEGTGAVDPPHIVRLAYSIYLLVDDVRPFQGASVEVTGDRVIGPTFGAALDQVRHCTDSVLLIGESGVGKELAAREFHGERGPFVSVNCATIPETVAERLLFGSVRGSFSGALDAEGYIAAADGGVLFLDEIGELDPQVQAKLLRVLETREVVPLGATRGRKVTTRFCFATLRNLRTAMSEDDFRADLYYRISRAEVHLPPLRERREEIPWLVHHELRGARAHARLIEDCLLRTWPGNVRELRTAIRAAAERAGDGVVRAEHLDPAAGRAPAAPTPASARPQDVTRDQLVAAIAEQHGNLSAVARALGLHRSQLYRLLDQHGIER
jgi:DNA-binding NtrC family response regulator